MRMVKLRYRAVPSQQAEARHEEPGAACNAAPGRAHTRRLTASQAYEDVQETSDFDTAPSAVGALKVHETVNTTTPAGCSTVIVADVNARSSMLSVQFGFGQPGAPAMGVVGATVVTENVVFPFLISLAGIATLPVTVSGAGFWPGALLPP